MNLKRLCENAESELSGIMERGLNANNLDATFKLVEIIKDVKKIENMGDDYSLARKRDSLGRYSRDYDAGNSYGHLGDKYSQYLDSKSAYRASGSHDAKQRVMQTLENYMDAYTKEIEEMLRDSDNPEERQTIQRYLNKIRAF